MKVESILEILQKGVYDVNLKKTAEKIGCPLEALQEALAEAAYGQLITGEFSRMGLKELAVKLAELAESNKPSVQDPDLWLDNNPDPFGK